MAKPYAYLNGEYLPLENANINVMTHGFLYGTAVFEGIRAYFNQSSDELYIFRAPEHYQRFLLNCGILRMEFGKTVQELVDITIDVLRRSEFHEDVYIRPVGYKSAQRIGLKMDDQNGLVIFAVPMGTYLNRERPQNLMVSSWRRVEDNAIPARGKINGGYVNLALAANEARENGFDEAILLNEDGSVSEAAGMNLFIVRSGVLITPPVSDNVLEGITRSTLFAVAAEMGIPLLERSVDRSELYVADEAFLCGTGAEIAPIGSIDRRKIGSGQTGPITSKILEVYYRSVRGQMKEHSAWTTPVWNAAKRP